jgi:hypothetical protein
VLGQHIICLFPVVLPLPDVTQRVLKTSVFVCLTQVYGASWKGVQKQDSPRACNLKHLEGQGACMLCHDVDRYGVCQPHRHMANQPQSQCVLVTCVM